MRISDWSSDVCSSDLAQQIGGAGHVDVEEGAPHQEVGRFRRDILRQLCKPLGGDHACKPALSAPAHQVCHRAERGLARRSEEHTSELQSLMRISYAVFCLKKKNTKTYTANRMTTAEITNRERLTIKIIRTSSSKLNNYNK